MGKDTEKKDPKKAKKSSRKLKTFKKKHKEADRLSPPSISNENNARSLSPESVPFNMLKSELDIIKEIEENPKLAETYMNHQSDRFLADEAYGLERSFITHMSNGVYQVLTSVLKSSRGSDYISNPHTRKFLDLNPDIDLPFEGSNLENIVALRKNDAQGQKEEIKKGPSDHPSEPPKKFPGRGFRRKNTRLGTITLPGKESEGAFLYDNQKQEQIKNYLAIGLLLSYHLQMDQELKVLFGAFSVCLDAPKSPPLALNHILLEENFMKQLIFTVLKYEEPQILELIFFLLPTLNILIDLDYLSIFEREKKYEYLHDFFIRYSEYSNLSNPKQVKGAKTYRYLGNNQKDKTSGSKRLIPEEENSFSIANNIPPQSAAKSSRSLRSTNNLPSDQINLVYEKMVLLTKFYLLSSGNNQVLAQIYQNLSIPHRTIISLFIDLKEQTRLIRLILSPLPPHDLLRYLSVGELVQKGLYKLLSLIDNVELITVLNMEPTEPNEHSQLNEGTIFKQICESIKDGQDIEELAEVLFHVHDTFWNAESLLIFRQAIRSILFNSNTSMTESSAGLKGAILSNLDHPNASVKKTILISSPRGEGTCGGGSSIDWLTLVGNPLLFSMKLLHFFKKTQKLVPSSDSLHSTNRLTEALSDFCLYFVRHVDEDVLVFNMFDKDIKDKEFLDYAFMIEESSLLETNVVRRIGSQMWDIGRHTMQTITQFMRLNFIKNEIKKFNWSIYCKKYEIPIEEDDVFQLEFRFTSNSVFLRVLSEIFWPMSLIIIEFIFSTRLIKVYQEDNFTNSWIRQYFLENPKFSVLHLYLRGNYIVSNMLKSSLLGMSEIKNFHHYAFYTSILILYFCQMVIYFFFFYSNFWVLLNLQMLIILTKTGYIFYNGLSVDGVGVVLRIFLNMVIVVLLFSLVSILTMTLLAYPLHSFFIDFSQEVDGVELNMFRSIYNGVLTLFEFVFGAVVFVRPYKSESVYTYAMSFIMVIFSFFGNIMLANMLVAFLAKQFESITKKAQYYTNLMQFGLTKIFNMQDMDSIFTMPFPLTLFAVPFYLSMIRGGSCRAKTNIFLRKVIHVVNVALPTILIMNCYLLTMILVRYFQIFFKMASKAFLRPYNWVYAGGWILVGPLFLLKLYVFDNCTMLKVLLDFKSEKHLLSTSLSDEAKNKLCQVFSKINKYAIIWLTEKPFQTKTTIEAFVKSMGVEKTVLHKLNKVFSEAGSRRELHSSDRSLGLDDDEEEMTRYFGIVSKFNAVYTLSEKKLIPILLKKYVLLLEKTDDPLKAELDLEFMVTKFQDNINPEHIQELVGFDRTTLYMASKTIGSNFRDTSLKNQVRRMERKVNNIDYQLQSLLSEISSVETLVKSKLTTK